ncbi:MAG: OsmC family protein [Myxococcota bacterium]|nr:OsmC family protein [Myxococcales bacterium]
MVRMHVDYQGKLRSEAVHEPSGSRIETDAPADNEGLAERFSPTDLVCAALASCILTTMGIVARRREWRIEGARVDVEKHMTTDPVRRIGRIVARIAMPAGIPEEARAVLVRTANTCPVHRSLHPDVELDIAFDWA